MHRRQTVTTVTITTLLLTAISGYYLLLPFVGRWLPFQLVTVGHIVLGLLLFLPLGWYLLAHLRPLIETVASILRDRDAQSGTALFLVLGACLLSGAVILFIGKAPGWANLHRWSSILTLPLLLLHFLLRLQAGPRGGRWQLLPLIANGSALGVLALVVIEAMLGPGGAPVQASTPQTFYLRPYAGSLFAPSAARTSDDNILPGAAFADPRQCRECHSEYYTAWQASMHAHSADDPVYQWLVGLLEQEQGREATRWCSGCHNPVSLLSGEISSLQPLPPNRGITCIVCHATRRVETTGNASYVVDPEAVHAYLEPNRLARLLPGDDAQAAVVRWARALLYKTQPAAHKHDLRPALTASSDFCATCHQEFSPPAVSGFDHPVPLQDTFREWEESPYNTGDPATTVTCQDCHMTPGPTAASKPNPGRNTDGVYAKAHIFTHDFQGANVTVPTLLGNLMLAQRNAESLQGAALITVTTSAQAVAGQPLEIAVQVTNVGAGHHLPTGVGEVRQMWLELTVQDGQSRELYHSGALAPDGSLPPEAAIFGLRVTDPDGAPIMHALPGEELRHQLWRVAQVVEDTRIPARETRTVRYTAPVPAGTSGPLQVRAMLHFREASQAIVNILMRDPAARIPVTDIADATLVLPVIR